MSTHFGLSFIDNDGVCIHHLSQLSVTLALDHSDNRLLVVFMLVLVY